MDELTAAGILDPDLRASYSECKRLNSLHGKTYYLATLLLPKAKRPHVHALYGFARYADEIVDDLASTLTIEEKAELLKNWGDGVLSDIRSGTSKDHVGRALVDTVNRFNIPIDLFEAFLHSMTMDLSVTHYQSYDDLMEYVYGSAAVIGLQMVPILGAKDPAAYESAKKLGIAFQLANFIRNELTNSVAEASEQLEKYLFKGSAGQGNWARGPWVAVFNPDITSSAQRGYYPVYLFREDMAGVYLSLNQAMTEQKELYKSDAKTALKAKAENFRAMLGPKTGGFNVNEIDLNPSAPSNDTAYYESGNIVAKYYPRDSIPNDEFLKKDLIQVLSLYDALLYGEAASESETIIDGDEPENMHYEDAGKLRLHKRIERNPKLAQAAKKILGCVCQVCGLDFEKRYGIIGKDYIEAHHLEPISELKGKKVRRDPGSDFAVLCSNCHRMIHKSSFVGDVQAFKKKHFKG